MYCKKLIFFLLLLVVIVTSSCKKESLTDEFGNDNVAVNIPSNPLDLDPAKIPVDTTKIVVIIGSSTAAGFGASVADSCWAGRLNGKLIADKKNVKVINLGVGGYTTYKLMPTLTPTLLRRPAVDTNKNVTAAIKFKPALVIINLPSNDIGANFRDEEIIKNYKVIVQPLIDRKIDYIITGTQPRNFKLAEQRTRLKILNDKMISAFPNHIADYLRKLSTPTYALQKLYSAGDGIHLNDKGHKVIYQAVFDFPAFKTFAGY